MKATAATALFLALAAVGLSATMPAMACMGYEFEKHVFLNPENLPRDGFAARVKITKGTLGNDFEVEVLDVVQGIDSPKHVTIRIKTWSMCHRFPEAGEVGVVAGTLTGNAETSWILEPYFGPAPRLWKRDRPGSATPLTPSTSNGS